MTLTDPILFYTVIATLALLIGALIAVVALLIRKLKKMKMHMYNDELELSAKIEF